MLEGAQTNEPRSDRPYLRMSWIASQVFDVWYRVSIKIMRLHPDATQNDRKNPKHDRTNGTRSIRSDHGMHGPLQNSVINWYFID